MSRFVLAILIAAVQSLAPNGRSGPEYSLSVSGDGVRSAKLTVADLEKLDQVKASVHEHDGSVASYEGPTLYDVLKQSGVVVADHPGKAMSAYVAVTASDGYEVVFGLGEAVPAISGRTIILADHMDGKPLPENVGPVRLIVDGDKAQARCIRMVTGIKLVQLRR